MGMYGAFDYIYFRTQATNVALHLMWIDVSKRSLIICQRYVHIREEATNNLNTLPTLVPFA